MENILLVDDEREITDLLEIYLVNDGYRVYKFTGGEEALRCVEKVSVDLAVIDVMLPDLDGFEVCRRVREKYFFPVIMLTARVEDTDKITGLTIGADDYITKPFNPMEVMARIKTQLRRYKRYNQAGAACSGAEHDIRGLYINRETHECRLFEERLELTPMEFDILWYLCDHRGSVVSSEQLFSEVWGERFLENSNNTVMTHIGRIREKMHESSRKPKFIKTVWGVGYKID